MANYNGDQADGLRRLFGRSQEEMSRLAFISVPVRVENADQSEVIGTLSADTPTAPDTELDLRCRFLETVATLVGRQVARLQEPGHILVAVGGDGVRIKARKRLPERLALAQHDVP